MTGIKQNAGLTAGLTTEITLHTKSMVTLWYANDMGLYQQTLPISHEHLFLIYNAFPHPSIHYNAFHIPHASICHKSSYRAYSAI